MPTLIRLLNSLEIITGCLLILLLTAGYAKLFAQEDNGKKKKLAITQAVMCEDIRDYEPQNRAAVFSISTGKVYCFTAFNPVPRDMYVYHSWYRRDRLITIQPTPSSWRVLIASSCLPAAL